MPPRRDPVIELEPRRPFSWKVVGLFVLLWLLAFVAAVVLKHAVIRLLLPAIAAALVVYLAVGTVLYLKNRR